MRAVDLSLHYQADPGEVVAMLTEAGFQEMVAGAASVRLADVAAHTLPGGETSLTVIRVVSADRLPDLVRTMIGSELTVRQMEKFAPTAPGRADITAGIDITVDNAPVSVTGSEVFAPSAGEPGGTDHRLHLEVSSSVPFFGAKVEQAAAPVITEALGMQESVAREWLAGR